MAERTIGVPTLLPDKPMVILMRKPSLRVRAEGSRLGEAGSGGGGAIKITAGGKLIVGKNIYANGGMGMADSTNGAAKSGAGGSGGAIYLKASDLVINSGVSIRADGGPSVASCHRRKQLCHRWWWC